MAGPGFRRAAEAGRRAVLTLAEARQPTVGGVTGAVAVLGGGSPAVGQPDLLALMSRGEAAAGAVWPSVASAMRWISDASRGTPTWPAWTNGTAVSSATILARLWTRGGKRRPG